ncbi:MAG: hypothetical protein IJ639_09540, partial [Ruminococcus sp.]|nr:hypothetical protein [Ruminococcus sp.]
MTYEGDGVYKYTITGTGDQLRFRSRFIDGSSEDDYYPSSTDDIRDNTSYSSGYGASTGSSSNYWHIDTQSGATYTVYLKNARVWIVVSGESYGYSLWGGDSKEFDSKGYLAPLTLNAATGLYDGSYTFNSTNWHSFVISASDSTSSFSTAWTSYSEVGWALDTYNNNATYQNYSSNHKEEMSDGLFSFVEITDRSSQYGLKLAARAEGTTINLSYDATNKILWLWGGTGSDKAIIYAKDGCINENRNTTRVLGTTTVTAVTDIVTDVERKSISNTECYTYAKAVKGEEITVTTTVADDYASKYLVKGWDVNGTTYGLDPTAVGTAYSATFTVPDADKVEITPIYWLKNGDVTTFFVKDFNNVPDGWGSALYYYYWGGSQVNVDNEEKYPGQPFVHEGGQYYAQVPTDVTGVTLNNAVWDTIHGTYIMGVSGNESANHWQTYDYDNFAKIVKEKTDLNSVYFTFKYESTKDNLGSATAASGSTITLSDYGTNGNGWEEYKNPLGEDINIFSEVLTSPGTGILYVVSNGYARNYQGDYATEWSVYYDSSGSGSTASFVGTIPSSALILDSSSDFATYSDSGYGPDITDYQNVWTTLKNTYSNYKVKITYEKGIYGGNTLINTSAKTKSGGTDNATRIDGKWDFILNSSYSTANIIIQKSTDNGSTYTEDTFVTNTNQGTTTQATAYFNNTGESYSGTHEVTTANEVVVSTTDKYKLKTVPNATTGYQFVGWYRLDDGSETPELISTSTEAESLMSSKATFIARYKYVTSGNLVINHAVNGEGKSTNHTVKVEIFADDATPGSDDPITSFTGESVTLGSTYISSNSTYKIRVTLTAIADANTSYIANSSAVPTVACSQDAATYYNNPSYTRTGRFATSVYPQNVVTTVDTFTIASLYGGDTSQNFTVLNYTTTFNKLPTYTINYKYHGRGMSGSDYLTFTRTITLSADEAEGKNAEGNDYSGNNGTALRPTYTTTQGDGLVNDITANAPDQNSLETDVFNKNISWSVPSTVTASPLTVYATETDPTYTLTYTYYDVNGTAHSAQTVTGSYNTLIRFGETSGTVATASTKGGQKFAYWADANDKPLTN